ncbi:unnamed protein product [Phytophthora fragariaefolia]|uniref:NAD(+) ADP-ribosyltransferase n=1 Tax=Phytophthora fragariaefolia TaxID=1490495 RepID=A0A9W6YG67_9STRA|nr:unnamed protein product [Phytophthora fragariaefolia]
MVPRCFMLNLTDISFGTYGCDKPNESYSKKYVTTNDNDVIRRNNKFYMGQLIVDRGQFVVFRKWGRVGAKTPQSKIDAYSTEEAAKAAFNKAFLAKSGNSWPLTQPFVHKKGKYFLVGKVVECSERV